jgi:endogenous inhibitor of DNA gyrase (YacG/DUF329 family)
MGDERVPPAGRSPRCPICGRPVEPRFRPFCSARCRDQDLLNWLGGRYAIPAQESEADEEDEGVSERR